MDIGLVALHMLSHVAGVEYRELVVASVAIRIGTPILVQPFGKQFTRFGLRILGLVEPGHQIDQAMNVMLNAEGVLPAVGLGE